jgi:hypothetical protein
MDQAELMKQKVVDDGRAEADLNTSESELKLQPLKFLDLVIRYDIW